MPDCPHIPGYASHLFCSWPYKTFCSPSTVPIAEFCARPTTECTAYEQVMDHSTPSACLIMHIQCLNGQKVYPRASWPSCSCAHHASPCEHSTSHVAAMPLCNAFHSFCTRISGIHARPLNASACRASHSVIAGLSAGARPTELGCFLLAAVSSANVPACRWVCMASARCA